MNLIKVLNIVTLLCVLFIIVLIMCSCSTSPTNYVYLCDTKKQHVLSVISEKDLKNENSFSCIRLYQIENK